MSIKPTRNIRVKFCGLTRLEDVECVEQLGADFVGFVFVPSSPRHISLDAAKKLRSALRSTKAVGVFDDNASEHIEECVRMLQLDAVQLYSSCGVDHRHSVPVIRAFRGVPDAALLTAALEHHSHVLIDKETGEEEADFERIAMLPASVRSRLFLAGGLTPGNVRSAVNRIRPFAVDCARGVETSPGIKDAHLLSAFLSSLPS